MELSAKIMEEAKEAFEFVQTKQGTPMDITLEVWIRRVLLKVIYDVLSEKRALE